MRFRSIFVVAILLAMAQSVWAQSYAADSAYEVAPLPRKVITWVPPYGVAATRSRLNALYAGVGPRNAITHLALQFWTPTAAGGLARSSRYGTISNATLKSFVTWAHNNNIKVVLCVYNGEWGWDWSLTQAAINPANRTKFVNAIMAQVAAHGLDGVDVDLEGSGGEYPADKANYVALVRLLSQRLHASNKVLTVDTFPWKWNAPNWNWWAALFPYVDGLNSMGYQDLGRNPQTPAEPWRYYSQQKAKAGSYANKLLIGIPADRADWLGHTTLDQVKWFRTTGAGRVGIAIWDAQFPHDSWKSAPVWNQLRAIRNQP